LQLFIQTAFLLSKPCKGKQEHIQQLLRLVSLYYFWYVQVAKNNCLSMAYDLIKLQIILANIHILI